jgi:glyoxylase-like metal-dependent hydrolase (beta-lactamase superfamily II)
MVCHCLILEGPDGLVLVDTGFGARDVADPRRLGRFCLWAARPKLEREQTAIAHVERLGYRAKDVRHIVPTHLDLDHAGGLADFPEATVHVFELEHRAAMRRRTRGERLRYREVQFAHHPNWALYPLEGDAWLGFDRVRVLGDDVALIPLVGHTRGHCGVAVRQGERWILHAGDAYFFHGELDLVKARCTPALALHQRLMAIDDSARRRNQVRLRELVRDHGGEVQLFCSHDPVELKLQASASAERPRPNAVSRFAVNGASHAGGG